MLLNRIKKILDNEDIKISKSNRIQKKELSEIDKNNIKAKYGDKLYNFSYIDNIDELKEGDRIRYISLDLKRISGQYIYKGRYKIKSINSKNYYSDKLIEIEVFHNKKILIDFSVNYIYKKDKVSNKNNLLKLILDKL